MPQLFYFHQDFSNYCLCPCCLSTDHQFFQFLLQALSFFFFLFDFVFLQIKFSLLEKLCSSLIVATFFLASSCALACSSRERLSSHFDGLFCDHMISASKDTTWAAGSVLRSTSKIVKSLSETILEVGTFDAWSLRLSEGKKYLPPGNWSSHCLSSVRRIAEHKSSRAC